MKVSRQFTFAAAHHLTDYQGACERPHGHTYRLEVTVAGPIRKDGLVLDFAELKRIVGKHILELLDHTDLNDRFENPSAEHIAVWIYNVLKKHEAEFGHTPTSCGTSACRHVVVLDQVRLWEGDTTFVTYDGTL